MLFIRHSAVKLMSYIYQRWSIFSSPSTSCLHHPKLHTDRSSDNAQQKISIHPDIVVIRNWDGYPTLYVHLFHLFFRWIDSQSVKNLWTSALPIPVFCVQGDGPPLLNDPHERYPKPVSSFVITGHFHQCYRNPYAICTILDLDRSWSSMARSNKCPTRLTIRRCIVKTVLSQKLFNHRFSLPLSKTLSKIQKRAMRGVTRLIFFKTIMRKWSKGMLFMIESNHIETHISLWQRFTIQSLKSVSNANVM